MDPEIFTFVDDSAEKISLETLFLIFVVWIFGIVFGLSAFAIELLVVHAWFLGRQRVMGRYFND